MKPSFQEKANALRILAADAVEAAKSGHPGMPMGMADTATVLFEQFLKFDAGNPDWADRDRFVLSAGHGSMLIYALLHLTGYARPTLDDIRNFRQKGSPCAGHPENIALPGVEVTTGPLGQGLAMGVGLALAERHLNARFGDGLVDHRTWVIAGDGCLMEGVSHEAAGIAGHLGLGRLKLLWDDNRISIDGAVDLASSEDVAMRFAAAGWAVTQCDGHDPDDVARALRLTLEDESRPWLVACRTTIGRGAPHKQGTSGVHGAPLGADEIAALRDTLGWTHPPFEIPDEIRAAWQAIGARGGATRAAWEARLNASPEKQAFCDQMAQGLPRGFSAEAAIKEAVSTTAPMATRKASECVLEVLTRDVPALIGGSADLTGSNNTRPKNLPILSAQDYAGRYIHYGVREFGMAAAMNGMALHGGIIPYGGTFLVFSDYCRSAIRLAALQHARTIFVLTHDSIGLGEDGPTHQPVEHLLSLRAIPNLHVFRPADLQETAECWALALERHDGPSVLALSRQNVPALDRGGQGGNLSARGAYRLRAARAARRIILVATGTEVALALAVADRLEAAGLGADIVSMPCQELFDGQDASCKTDIFPTGIPVASIEAGLTLGWEKYARADLRFGVDGFGLSAPAGDIYAHFGLTEEKIASQLIGWINHQ